MVLRPAHAEMNASGGFGGGLSPEEEGGTAVGTESKARPNFKVVLFNDEDHTYDYVVEMLTLSCKLPRDAAFRCAVEVDLTGRTVVFYGTESECRRICAQILKFGPDHRLPHSMSSMEAEVQSH